MKILFVGDVMIGRLVNEVLRYEEPKYVWGDTLEIFKKTDLRICNLECVISDKGEPWSLTPKVFHFRSDAKNIEVLKVANINIVSLANNHTLDFGYEAMFEMLEIFKKNNIYYAGAGENLEKASMPVILEIPRTNANINYQRELIRIDNDKVRDGSRETLPDGRQGSHRFATRVGFIAFTDNEPHWAAEKDKPGIFYVELSENGKNLDYLLNLIKETKKKIDFLIVSAHWGPNWGYEPLEEHKIFAKKFIDAGADFIFGHSPHIFRGIEIYKDKFILYSTGDFIDDYAVDEIERNDESFIFVYMQTTADDVQTTANTTHADNVRGGSRDSLRKSAYSSHKFATEYLGLYPTMIENFQAKLAKGKDKERIIKKIEKLCKKLKCDLTKIKFI